MPRKAVDSEVRLQSLNLKTTADLREKLEAASVTSGRPLTYEVETRINRTFEYDYLFGDNETALVLRAVAMTIHRFEKATGKQWVKDAATQQIVYDAVVKMFEVMMKPSPLTDDRIVHTEPGLPLRLDDPEMRAGWRKMALDTAIHELQEYRKLKEQELKRLRPARGPRTTQSKG